MYKLAVIFIALFALMMGVRALYVLYSVSSFKNSWAKTNSSVPSDDALIVVALGDSTVQGIGGVKRSDSFVDNVTKRVSATTGRSIHVYNYSVTGFESGQVLADQIPKLAELKRIDAIMIAVGPNDITHKKSLDDFLKNYTQILQKVPADKTIVASLPPMGPRDTEGRTSYEWGVELQKLAKQYNVRVAPVFEHVNQRANDPRIYGGDFYHPSSVGYSLWADAFEQPLSDVLSQQLK